MPTYLILAVRALCQTIHLSYEHHIRLHKDWRLPSSSSVQVLFGMIQTPQTLNADPYYAMKLYQGNLYTYSQGTNCYSCQIGYKYCIYYLAVFEKEPILARGKTGRKQTECNSKVPIHLGKVPGSLMFFQTIYSYILFDFSFKKSKLYLSDDPNTSLNIQ